MMQHFKLREFKMGIGPVCIPYGKRSISFSLPEIFILLLAIALLVYTILRASFVELIPDEIFSWRHFAYGPHLYPQVYDQNTANDHWLNSWLIQFSGYLFGEHNWSIRLPNLLAHAVYLFFTARFALQSKNKWFAVAAFILLNAHPYLLDFFSAARGYGLAYAGMAAGIFHLIRFTKKKQQEKDLNAILLWSMLAVLANFAVISFYLVLTGIILLLILTGEKQNRLSQLRKTGLVILPFLLVVVPHLVRMQKSGALYYGENSLWEGTVKTVTESLLYDVPYVGENHFCSAKPVIWFIEIFLLASSCWLIRKNGLKAWFRSTTGIVFLVFAGTVLTIVLQHTITGALYPSHRVGLFLFVLCLFALVSMMNALLNNRLLLISGIALCIPVVLHFSYCANISFIHEWKSAAGTETAATDINRIYEKSHANGKTVTVYAMGVNGITLQFLKEHYQLSWMDVQIDWGSKQPESHDFYYVEKWALPGFNSSKWIPIDTFAYSGNVLFVDTAFSRLVRKE